MIHTPSDDHDGIEAPPVFVSWTEPSSSWIQMLPPFAYAIEPRNVASSGITITPDGAGVRPGPGTPPLPLPPLPPAFENGSS